MKFKWPQRHYIDLFSGAGLAKLRDTGEIVQSSSLIAAGVRDPFTRLHLCERDPVRFDALVQRVTRLGIHERCQLIRGDANEYIDQILNNVPLSGALSVAFIDPFGLHFDFATAKRLSARRVDLIVLLADNMDAMRNWAAYYKNNPTSTLDNFMGEPGWRERFAVAGHPFAEVFREHYSEQLRTIGYAHFGWERISNSANRDIYTLLFASRSPKGLEFWEKASSVDEGGQRQLFGGH